MNLRFALGVSLLLFGTPLFAAPHLVETATYTAPFQLMSAPFVAGDGTFAASASANGEAKGSFVRVKSDGTEASRVDLPSQLESPLLLADGGFAARDLQNIAWLFNADGSIRNFIRLFRNLSRRTVSFMDLLPSGNLVMATEQTINPEKRRHHLDFADPVSAEIATHLELPSAGYLIMHLQGKNGSTYWLMGSADGSAADLLAVDGQGSLLFHRQYTEQQCGPIVVGDDAILMTCGHSVLYLDSQGQETGRFTVPGNPTASFAPDGNVVIVPYSSFGPQSDGNVYFTDAKGKELSRRHVGDVLSPGMQGLPLFFPDGSFYVSSLNIKENPRRAEYEAVLLAPNGEEKQRTHLATWTAQSGEWAPAKMLQKLNLQSSKTGSQPPQGSPQRYFFVDALDGSAAKAAYKVFAFDEAGHVVLERSAEVDGQSGELTGLVLHPYPAFAADGTIALTSSNFSPGDAHSGLLHIFRLEQ